MSWRSYFEIRLNRSQFGIVNRFLLETSFGYFENEKQYKIVNKYFQSALKYKCMIVSIIHILINIYTYN